MLIALVFVLDRSGWWLLLLVPHFVGTVAGCFPRRSMPNSTVTAALHVVALLVALTSLSVISWWFIIAAAIGWMLVAGSSTDNPDADPKGARR
ncbi:hypothetical protein [Streptomyces sp. NPDC058382]|uniref:hypothetical protein n=1 Tax=unclassified Streptomyces TaxID=2593676 RepID=UPI00363E47F5